VAAAHALRAAAPGARVVACDSGGQSLSVREREGLAAAGVEVHVDTDGTHLLQASPPPATVVKSPGVPWDAPVVAQAPLCGATVVGELEIGWRLVPNEFIAVTGTNGKTTTVELIGAMHRAADAPVAVAGNVGTPVSSLARTVDPAATIACEASSFQLEDTVAFAPEAAVFLNFTPDHLDRHPTVHQYLDSKLRIFAHQEPSDLAVVREPLTDMAEVPARAVRFGEGPRCEMRFDGERLLWRGEPLIDAGEVRLRGRHNLDNAMAAAAVSLARGLDPEAVRTALREFAGGPHRMEQVAEIRGVTYVNDSKATNGAAAVAAIESFTGGVHVILGGSRKGAGFGDLAAAVAARCVGCYLIGEAADELEVDLFTTGVPLEVCGDLDRAVRKAALRSRPGEVVLLSPACASFDQYRDYEERGKHFRTLVSGLA
jgi:UDP-N-acetylmuramoylalanine--D-glutamate ligase